LLNNTSHRSYYSTKYKTSFSIGMHHTMLQRGIRIRWSVLHVNVGTLLSFY